MGRLTDKYCIVGVGETPYTKNSGRTTRAMAVEAVRNAMRDAGLQASQVNGMLSYHGGDSCVSPEVASDLGIRLDFYMDCSGGGSSTEALIGLATGAIEVGMCETVAIFRSMNGYSEVRIGGTGRRNNTAEDCQEFPPINHDLLLSNRPRMPNEYALSQSPRP